MLEQELVNYSSRGKSLFYYKGSFVNKPSLVISHIVEDFISAKHLGKVKRKTLFFLIEIAQNIEKYSEHDSNHSDSFLIYSKPGNITLESQNVIKNSSLITLKEQLEKINSSSQDELKEMFTTKLSESLTADKKSPGLGFIELKRKNKRSFDFNFEKIDDERSNFSLKVEIDDLSEEETAPDHDDGSDIEKIKSYFQKEKEIIVFVGDLESSAVAPVVQLVEKVEFSSEKGTQSKYQHSLIELLQNAKEHSKKVNGIKSGFFLLKKDLEEIMLSCCNHSDDNSDVLKAVEDLNNASKEELENKSKEALLDFDNEGGLGLIQVANLTHPGPLLSKTIYDGNNETFLYIECSFK